MFKTFRLERFQTVVGEILLVTDPAGQVRALDFGDYEARMMRLLRLHYGDTVSLAESAPMSEASAGVAAYLAGRLDAIDEVEVATGGTPFQRQVWAALRRIPHGATTTYGELARSIGRDRAVRAVGAANGANPVAIIVPCHRVIGAGGGLTGYAGGLQRKSWLLAHERANAGSGAPPP